MAGTGMGVQKTADGQHWTYLCTCGAMGEVVDGRDTARENYRLHRLTHPTAAPAQGQTTTTTAQTSAPPDAGTDTGDPTPALEDAAVTTATAPKPRKTKVKKEKKEKASRATFSDADAKEVLAGLKAGTTTLKKERTARGYQSNAPMRRVILNLMGGDKKAYLALVRPVQEKKEKPAKAKRVAKKK